MGNRLISAKNRYHTYEYKFGDGRMCKCGHDYRSHFGNLSDNERHINYCTDVDDHSEIELVECAHCKCKTFNEVLPKLKQSISEIIQLIKPKEDFMGMPEEMIKEIEEGRLIANFVGLVITSEQCNHYLDPIEYDLVIDAPEFIPEHDVDLLYEFESYPEFDYKFDSDWNWLMGVIGMVENLRDEDGCYLFSVDTGRDYCTIHTNDLLRHIIAIGSVNNDKVASIYQTVIKFIKWYNKQDIKLMEE